MSLDAAEQVHRQFLDALEKGTARRRSNLGLKDVGLAPKRAAALFRSQALSRQLDRMSRKLQARGEGFYTIGSSGHEGNAVLAEVLRVDDMAFLHYRDAAFQIHRAHRVPGENPAWDMLLSFAASAEDPISGGRHKVLGSKRLFIPPQTSTIASHLPKAVGTAFSIGIARRMGWSDTVLAKDGVVLCSFGDASANHSTALGAINTACWAAFQGTPMPIVFLCEDNGIGISTRTPPGWIEANFSGRAGLHYIACDGSDLVDTMRAAREAEAIARRQRKPVFLHMKTVRLYGHAGNDVQLAYRSKDEIRAEEERDPLLASAALLIEEGVMSAAEVRAVYDEIETTLERQVELAIRRPKLPDAAAVMASIVPPRRDASALLPLSPSCRRRPGTIAAVGQAGEGVGPGLRRGDGGLGEERIGAAAAREAARDPGLVSQTPFPASRRSAGSIAGEWQDGEGVGPGLRRGDEGFWEGFGEALGEVGTVPTVGHHPDVENQTPVPSSRRRPGSMAEEGQAGEGVGPGLRRGDVIWDEGWGEARARLFADDAAAMDKPQHMAKLLSWALADLLLQYPNAIVCGEDVGPKGGVYAATQKLHARFGSARVINTLLDEQAILGLAIGAAHNGLLPLPEIQFLAYVHNAEDQIRGEAATLSFFSDGQYTNPMVVRIAGLPYQKGFGGHFHNDNSLAVFRDIPGVVLAVPSNGRDAVAMLRECVRLAHEEQRVVVFVEPIALYMTRDLHEAGDGLWASLYQPPGEGEIAFGEIGIAGEGTDLAIVTYGNGYYLSLQAQKLLAEQGIAVRVIDLRWLGPVNDDAVIEVVAPCSRVLVVDECRITGGQNEALMALLAERAPGKAIARMAATDSFIPLARAATHTLPSREGIVAKVLEMVRG